MAIDPYANCPGGTGKKIKFCCPDLVQELDQLHHMIESEQRQASLDRIRMLDLKFPGRACLLTAKAQLERALGLNEAAEQTVTQLRGKQPDNPVVLAEAALIEADKHGAVAGVALLQQAIAACGQEFPLAVFETIASIGPMLLNEGHFYAFRGHLLLELQLQPQDEQVWRTLAQVLASPQISPLMKQDLAYEAPATEVPWRSEFEAAALEAARGAWAVAVKKFEALAVREPRAASLWQHLAVLRGWLADEAGMVEALRRFAALDVPLDDAVEAEALAQQIDPQPYDHVEQVVLTFPIRDMEKLIAGTSLDKRIVRLGLDPAQLAGQDQPPPKSAFWLLDRPQPATGVDLPASEVPRIVGRALVFGRETDREARVEIDLPRDDVANAKQLLTAVAPEALGEPTEDVIGKSTRAERILTWNLRLPDDTPPTRVPQLAADHRRRALLDVWPQTKLELLGGKTPTEAAADPNQRIKVLAAILNLELMLDAPEVPELANELRRQLKLPVLETIDPTGVDMNALSLLRFVRVDVKKLTDEQLSDAYEKTLATGLRLALARIAPEVLERPAMESKYERSTIYGMMAGLERDADRVLERLAQARSAAEKAGKSCARWDLEEFVLRLQRQDSREATALLQHLQSKHGNEPGVRQALMQLLYEAGVIGPDGRPTAGAGAGVRAGGSAEAVGMSITGPEPAPGKIWTPGGDAPTGKKTALWTPGMD